MPSTPLACAKEMIQWKAENTWASVLEYPGNSSTVSRTRKRTTMATFVKSPCDEGVIRSAPEATPCAPHVGVWVLVATILGSSMAFIDGSVVNVALPVIQRDLSATASDVQWIVETYALFLAALILVGGSLGDHFGRRRIYAPSHRGLHPGLHLGWPLAHGALADPGASRARNRSCLAGPR